MKKRIFATLLALVMALGLCVTTAWAEEVTYLKADGTTGTCPEYKTVTSGTETIWYAGWYVVKENVTINGPVTINDEVNLILYDGATLTVKTNDTVPIKINNNNASLTVYGQTGQSGTLKTETEQAIIGINGSITVNSGRVTAHSSDSHGRGIDGNVTVNGGRVEAYGKYQLGIDGNVTVNGGTVIAECDFGKGIGGNVTLPDSYKWRTEKNGAFTKSSATAYSNKSKPNYVEIVACHDFGTWVDEVPATCTATGIKGHKTCSICDKDFDINGVEISDLTIPTTGHHLTHVDARAATRQESGNIEYWQCSDCGKYFADAAAEKEITQADTVIAKLPPKNNNNNNSTPTTATTETVASPKTADAGVLLSGALALTSLLGMGYVGKKR